MFTFRHGRLLRYLLALGALYGAAPAQAAFYVEVFDSAIDITSMAQAEALMNRPADAVALLDVINFNDEYRGLDGYFDAADGFANGAFPGGLRESFAMRATTTLRVPTGGLYTFGFDSDDGAILRIGGVATVVDSGLHARRTTLAVTFLAAGDHALELVYFENHLTATIELFAAAGKHHTFSPAIFRLVGDQVGGGLPANSAVPLPPSCLLLLGALASLGFRRRTAPDSIA